MDHKEIPAASTAAYQESNEKKSSNKFMDTEDLE